MSACSPLSSQTCIQLQCSCSPAALLSSVPPNTRSSPAASLTSHKVKVTDSLAPVMPKTKGKNKTNNYKWKGISLFNCIHGHLYASAFKPTGEGRQALLSQMTLSMSPLHYLTPMCRDIYSKLTRLDRSRAAAQVFIVWMTGKWIYTLNAQQLHEQTQSFVHSSPSHILMALSKILFHPYWSLSLFFPFPLLCFM